MKNVGHHHSAKLACHRLWSAPAPYSTDETAIVHLCRGHVVETGECACPCGAKERAKP